jgi:hypothetical protein
LVEIIAFKVTRFLVGWRLGGGGGSVVNLSELSYEYCMKTGDIMIHAEGLVI